MSALAGFWSVPRMWRGETVAILAGGASLTAEIVERVRGLPVVAVNTAFRLAPWAEALYAADAEWWAHETTRGALDFRGLRVSVSQVGPRVLRLRNTGTTGFDPDPQALRTGGNSGYQALHMAMHAGAARVLLCGFDMQGPHWHGRHPPGLRTTAPETYALWRKRFEALIEPAASRGVDVVNCSPGSALRCFRTSTVEAELAPRPQSPAPGAALSSRQLLGGSAPCGV